MATAKKDKVLAAVLALFLGDFGVHQFYLGNNGKGLLYLLFCWTAIPAIIGFVDFVLLLIQGDAEFNRKYNMGYR